MRRSKFFTLSKDNMGGLCTGFMAGNKTPGQGALWHVLKAIMIRALYAVAAWQIAALEGKINGARYCRTANAAGRLARTKRVDGRNAEATRCAFSEIREPYAAILLEFASEALNERRSKSPGQYGDFMATS